MSQDQNLNPPDPMQAPAPDALTLRDLGQVVLVFQGGGALGAYQVGVYRALHEAGVDPDWVIGTSIGAINGVLIAGNSHGQRLERLRTFWRRIEHGALREQLSAWPGFGPMTVHWSTIMQGVAGFFTPNPFALANPHWPLAPESVGYYTMAALRETLADLVDLKQLNGGGCRLTVGAAHVCTGQMRYFDSRDEVLDLRHVLASGALPPSFPPVRIGDDLYWVSSDNRN